MDFEFYWGGWEGFGSENMAQFDGDNMTRMERKIRGYSEKHLY